MLSMKITPRICRLPFFLLGVLSATAATDYPTPYFFNTLAGDSSIGSIDANGRNARFWGPASITRDASGNLYVADTGNHTIRKIAPDGSVSTYAGEPGVSDGVNDTDGPPSFMNIGSLAVAPDGGLYLVDTYNIRKLSPTGAITTLAGSNYYGNTDGTGANASFDAIDSLTIDATGNLYLTANHAIRKVTPTGVVTTLAGLSGQSGNVDAAGSAARFGVLGGIAVDAGGTLYVADRGNHTIRKITPSGSVSTLAGVATTGYFGGSTDGPAQVAQFYLPYGLAIDRTGNLYLADIFTVRKITPDGTVSTLAGAPGLSGDTDGAGGEARFNNATALTTDDAGNVYVADRYNNNIRKITPAGIVTTIAGLSPFQTTGSADGTGSAARFSDTLGGTAVASSGNVYVADTGNHTIRKITPAGVVTTLAGSPGQTGSTDGVGNAARFNQPVGIAVDGGENLYVTDTRNYTVRKITPAGTVTTLAGSPGQSGESDGTGSAARFQAPWGIAVDAAGNVHVTDIFYTTGRGPYDVTRKITPAGVVTTVVPILPNYSGRLGDSLALDSGGNVCRFYQHALVRVDSSGQLTTIAGTVETRGLVDGTGAQASFVNPLELAADRAGNFYVTDASTVRRVSVAGKVETLAGLPTASCIVDGTGKNARFLNYSGWLSADQTGNVFLISGSMMRKGQLAGPPAIATQPASQTVALGGTVQFSVTATGVPSPTYQWYCNGAPFQNATASTLSFTNARSSDAGDYTVTITNTLGTVTSNKATLTVNAPSTPPPSGNGGGSSGGGGGAPSIWFGLALCLLAALRGRSRFSPSSGRRLH